MLDAKPRNVGAAGEPGHTDEHMSPLVSPALKYKISSNSTGHALDSLPIDLVPYSLGTFKLHTIALGVFAIGDLVRATYRTARSQRLRVWHRSPLAPSPASP